MISRRSFLKALGAGAVTAVVPLPVPDPDSFAVTGHVISYFIPSENKFHTVYVESLTGKLKRLWVDGKEITLNAQSNTIGATG